MNWLDGVLTFKQVAFHHSFSAAARAMDLPASVVTKRVHWLEKQLGLTLFVRTTRVVRITDAGEYLLQCVTPLLQEWQDIEHALKDYHGEPQGKVVIYAPPNISTLPRMTSVFSQFLSQYPKLKLQLITASQPVCLLQTKADILFAPEKYLLDPQNAVGIKLFPLRYQCYGSPSYFAHHDIPLHPTDLAQHNCLVFRNDHQWKFSNQTVPVSGNWQTDSGDGLINACVAGVGLSYLPSFMVENEVGQNQLRVVLTDYAVEPEWMHIFYLQSRYLSLKTKRLLDWMRRCLTQQ